MTDEWAAVSALALVATAGGAGLGRAISSWLLRRAELKPRRCQ